MLVSAVVLLLMDRSMGTAFYLSDIFIGGEALDVTGGSPILYQHLFWFWATLKCTSCCCLHLASAPR